MNSDKNHREKEEKQPSFHWALTVVLTLLMGGYFLHYSYSEWRGEKPPLERVTIDHFLNQSLYMAEGLRRVPNWERKYLWGQENYEKTLAEIESDVSRYEEEIATGESSQEGHHFWLDYGVILLERGEKRGALKLLETGKLTPFEERLIQWAYFKSSKDTSEIDFLLQEVEALLARNGGSWALYKIASHLREKGHPERFNPYRAHLNKIGEKLVLRGRLLYFLNFFFISLGISLLLIWLTKNRPSLDLASPVQWPSLPVGYALFIRAMTLGWLVTTLLSLLLPQSWLVEAGRQWAWGDGLAAGAELVFQILFYLPLALFFHYFFFRPRGQSLVEGLGLKIRREKWKLLVAIALVVFSLDLICGWLISFLPTWGEGDPWGMEGTMEVLIWGSWGAVILYFCDLTLVTPAVEEFTFRGIIYSIFRSRWGFLMAAFLSASSFAFIHFYSLQGFLNVFVGALLWAYAYEKTRSLWPVILAHTLFNATVGLYYLLLHRI